MRDRNAQELLAKVMGWQDQETVLTYVPQLQLLADFKYDSYQRFGPGKRFIESLALWLNQFDQQDRQAALDFVLSKLIYLSEAELSHLVQTAYPDLIVQEQMRLVAEELAIQAHRVGTIRLQRRLKELRLKSLYLGLSDGAKTSELRRASNVEIGNEQIWQAYELGQDKIEDMLSELADALTRSGLPAKAPKFNLVWLLDDFSGSGNTYIRFDPEKGKYKGKIKKIYDQLHRGELVDTSHFEVFLLLYVATRQAIDHIEYWAERFASEHGYKTLQLKVLYTIEREITLVPTSDDSLKALLTNPKYSDERVVDKHFLVGGTKDPRLGFAGCALPLVLSHNTPNNSIFILWGPETLRFPGLFPRVSRHREL